LQLNLGFFDGSLVRTKVPALTQMDSATSNRKIQQGITEVAKSKGLDFVLEATGVYDGGSLVITKGTDISNDLITLLSKDSK
jgi:Skp family chaperone for outer membrane proteins